MPHSTARRVFEVLRREPLMQFLAIGLVVFALDQASREEVDDPRLMRIDAPIYGEIVDVFAEVNGRAPTAEEMRPLVDRWVLNETLYREALALGLDEGDDMIKERIAQKMRVLIQSAVAVSAPEEDVLRAFYDQRRDAYAQPALLSIEIARLDEGEAAARTWADRLNETPDGGADLGRDAPPIYPFLDRPRPAMESVFGAAFVAEAEALPTGVWTAMDTPDGWHVARLLSRTDGYAASFEEARNAVLADWRDFEFRKRSREAVETLIDRYAVRASRYDPADFAARAAALSDIADLREAAAP